MSTPAAPVAATPAWVTDGTRPRVAVVVPTLNRRDDLRRFTATLVQQDRLPDELVIVDAGTPSDIEARLGEWLGDSGIALKYLHSPTKGTSLQRNLGIDLAQGDVLFFFDDDVLLEPDYISATLAAFGTDPSTVGGKPIGCVMGGFTHPPPTKGVANQIYRLFRLTHYTDADDPRLFAAGGVRWVSQPSRTIAIPVAYGGATAYLREALGDLRFDQYMPGYVLNEDVELAYRVARSWTLVQSPAVMLDHVVSEVSRDGEGERIARYVYALFYFNARHRPRDARHVGAWLWANAGIVGLNLARGAKPGPPTPRTVLGGLVKGYASCVGHLFGRAYR